MYNKVILMGKVVDYDLDLTENIKNENEKVMISTVKMTVKTWDNRGTQYHKVMYIDYGNKDPRAAGHLSRELCLLIKSLYKHLPQFV
jgi:hypothetical protein